MKSKIFITFFFFLILYSSCGEYEALEIQKEAKRVADSTFRAHRDSLTKMNTALCDLRYDSIFQIYFDSMMIVEKEKIIKLIQK